jgi:RND family efflux transporter MFP subunit
MLADRIRPFVVVMGLGAFMLAGCRERPGEASATAAPTAVELVRIAAAERGTLTLPARVKAAEEATLAARVSGRVSAFLAREGQVVSEGELLVRFDAPEARHALDAARADEQAARVSAEVAARQHTRMESLYTAGVVAQAERENAEAGDHGAAARLAQATAARELAESAFEVRAPFAGVLVRRHVDAGADVQPGSPLVDLRSPSGVEVVAAVPEAATPSLASARAWVQVDDGAWREARLLRADGMLDPATRTRTARFAPRDRDGLEPGAYARVRLELPGAEGGIAPAAPIVLPLSCVVRRGALTGVFVVEQERAWLRWVRLGRTQGSDAEVLSGLERDAHIVALPGALIDGARVTVTP